MKSDRRPPLAKSPMRLRTRRALRPTNTNTPSRTPIGSMTKTQMKESKLKPEYHHTVSCEIKALAKIVQDELGALTGFGNNNNTNTNNLGCLLSRGRFYDEYSARRNERLKKKQSETGECDDEPKTGEGYNLGVKVESSAKKKKYETLKNSVTETYTVDRSQRSRYALRSMTKKLPLPLPMAVEETTGRKSVASRTRRK